MSSTNTNVYFLYGSFKSDILLLSKRKSQRSTSGTGTQNHWSRPWLLVQILLKMPIYLWASHTNANSVKVRVLKAFFFFKRFWEKSLFIKNIVVRYVKPRANPTWSQTKIKKNGKISQINLIRRIMWIIILIWDCRCFKRQTTHWKMTSYLLSSVLWNYFPRQRIILLIFQVFQDVWKPFSAVWLVSNRDPSFFLLSNTLTLFPHCTLPLASADRAHEKLDILGANSQGGKRNEFMSERPQSQIRPLCSQWASNHFYYG